MAEQLLQREWEDSSWQELVEGWATEGSTENRIWCSGEDHNESATTEVGAGGDAETGAGALSSMRPCRREALRPALIIQ